MTGVPPRGRRDETEQGSGGTLCSQHQRFVANLDTKADCEQIQQKEEDLKDRKDGMFAIGSAEPRPELVKLLKRIGEVITGTPGQIVIKGHTDARPFRSKTYDNWRLSSARAHMALYMLTRGGVSKERFDRVEGYADRHLKDPDDPFAAGNRRIEIYLLEGGQ